MHSSRAVIVFDARVFVFATKTLVVRTNEPLFVKSSECVMLRVRPDMALECCLHRNAAEVYNLLIAATSRNGSSGLRELLCFRH